MTRNLSLDDQAYNACIDALNDAEDRLVEAADDRERAWKAAEALHGLGRHGETQSTLESVKIGFRG